MPNTPSLEDLIHDFISRITALVEARAQQQARAAVLGVFGDGRGGRGARRGPGRPPGRRTVKLTPKGLRTRKLQGRYLGALRGLKGADRAKVKALAKDKGVAAAVALAHKLAK